MDKSFCISQLPSQRKWATMVSLTIHLRCTSILCTYFTAILKPGFFAVVKVICGMSIWWIWTGVWCNTVRHHDICSPSSSCHTLICHSTALYHHIRQWCVYSGYKVAAAKTWLIAASFPALVTLQLNPVISQYYFLLLGQGIWIGRHVQISLLYDVTV